MLTPEACSLLFSLNALQSNFFHALAPEDATHNYIALTSHPNHQLLFHRLVTNGKTFLTMHQCPLVICTNSIWK